MRRIDDMYVKFRGVRSDDVGALPIGMPQLQVSAVRADKTTIPGRDGFLTVAQGYSEISVRVDFAVPDAYDLPAVKKWLTGSGELEFGDNEGYAYEATVLTASSLTSLTKRMDGKKISVTFTCQPFLHKVKEAQIELTQADLFNGQGDLDSMPLLKVEGSGTGTLIVNGRSMTLVLTSGTPLYIDCDAGTAYVISDGSAVFAGGSVSVDDDWFVLHPKAGSTDDWNYVSFSQEITKVTITPRWRFL